MASSASKYEKFVEKIVNRSNLNKLIDDPEDIKNIATSLIKWEENCDKFNLNLDVDVPDIKETYPEPQEQRIAVIMNWIDSNPERGTYDELLKICSDTGMTRSANTIVKCCNNEIGEREKKAKERYKFFIRKVNKQSNLQNDIANERHIMRIANDLRKWKENCHKFGLKIWPDVQDIKEKYWSNPFMQRITFLMLWRDKCTLPTFEELLKICASITEMSACANTIIEILNEDFDEGEDSNNEGVGKPESDHGVNTERQASGDSAEGESLNNLALAMDKQHPGYEDQKGKGHKRGRSESQTDVEGKGRKQRRSSKSQAVTDASRDTIPDSKEKPLRKNDYEGIKVPKPQLENVDYDSFCKRVQFVISTVNDREFNAGSTALKCPDVEGDSEKITTIVAGVYIGNIGRHAVGLVQHQPGPDCKDELTKAIKKYFPNTEYLVAVGVCYGFSREETALGDVVIAEQIIDLGNYRISKNSIEIRGDHTNMMKDIRNIFCRNPNLVEGLEVADNRKAKHIVGKIATSPNLIDNATLKKKIDYQVQPNAYGGEMEGGGLLKLQKDGIQMVDGTEKHVQVIIIKAVVDYADGTKKKEWQFIAAQAAFHYVIAKIELQQEKYPKVKAGVHDPSLVADGSGGINPDSDEETILTNAHYSTICKQLEECSDDWEAIAIQLNFKPNEIDKIEKNPQALLKSNWMNEVIKFWLRWAPGDKRGSTKLPTLQTLQQALNGANYASIKIQL